VWSATPAPNIGGSQGDVLSAVSCTAVAVCAAVGSTAQGTLSNRWNGSTWTAQPTPVPYASPQYSQLTSVSCVSDTACVTVGQYADQLFNRLPFADAWDGSAWMSMPMPGPMGTPGSQLAGVSCPSATMCVAVGSNGDFQSFSELWNGSKCKGSLLSAWTPPGSTQASLSSVSCPTTRACVAVGSYIASGQLHALTEQWNGSAWTAMGNAQADSGTLVSVACTTSTSCMAVGSTNASTPGAFAESWDGTGWQSVPTPAGAGSQKLLAVACPAAGTCEAVGYGTNGGSSPQAPIVDGWDGATWSQQLTPSFRTASRLSGVSCGSTTLCTAVGYQSNGAATLAEQWNGSAWALQLTPNSTGATSNSLDAVACPTTTTCVAIGRSQGGSPGMATTLAERWDGTSWVAQPIPTQGLLLSVSCPTTSFCSAAGAGGKSLGDSSGNGTNLTLVESYVA